MSFNLLKSMTCMAKSFVEIPKIWSINCLRPYHFSTWMGDRLGIHGVVDILSLFYISCNPQIPQIKKNDPYLSHLAHNLTLSAIFYVINLLESRKFSLASRNKPLLVRK